MTQVVGPVTACRPPDRPFLDLPSYTGPPAAVPRFGETEPEPNRD
ncbi:hypothetical protein STXM2123_721 [Streptomyces sp. F-3]|nr:hypothetical protein STXM2123_721 [Streptomyces sp. F-3]